MNTLTSPTDPLDVLAEIAHHRDLFRALYRVAVDQQRRIGELERMVSEMREERSAIARHLFGRTPADEPGEAA